VKQVLTVADHETPADRVPGHAVDVAVALPVFATFTYQVPDPLADILEVGKRVLVPFGKRRVTGYLLGPAEQLPGVSLKPIAAVLDDKPLFPSAMVPFFQWIADYYIHPLGEVVQAALPSGINIADQMVYSLTDSGREVLSSQSLAAPEEKVFLALNQGPCRLSRVKRSAGKTFSPAMLTTWQQKGWIAGERRLVGASTRSKAVPYVFPMSEIPDPHRLSGARRKVLALLAQEGPMALADLRRRSPSSANLVRAMARDGQVQLMPKTVYRDPFGTAIIPDQSPELTVEQQSALETIGTALGKGFETFLLSGVTGSGKTEIYLHLARRVIDQHKTVLVLVPEIALISQMARSFRARFGECVAVLHSGLSNGERFDQWQRILNGQATIVVGVRSAVFAPLADPGLIIVDEEHDDSYKQEGALRYNARDLAVVRARQCAAVAVLGSATPSLQSAYNARRGKYRQVNLFERVDNRVLPRIVVEDLTAAREEQGVRRFLTPCLMEAMQATLDRKEQVLLFLNRRGFAGTLVCAACGEPMRCDRCDISMTYHQKSNAYKCHYCGFSRAAATRCSRCGSDRIKRLGLGTEKLEAKIRELFPRAAVARMDRDTTARKGALLKILKDLRDRKTDILIGTQMVAKGHDFPFITLVGIICADLSLSLPDFRAGERTFQLLAQVAGRAGRGQTPGRVILQTYNPDHFSIEAARHQDFEAFYRQEIEFRKALGYPPLTRMIQIRISGADKAAVARMAETLGDRCGRFIADQARFRSVAMLGPAEAPLQRIADQYRWQLLLKDRDAAPLHLLVNKLLFGRDGYNRTGRIKIQVDVDPVFLM